MPVRRFRAGCRAALSIAALLAAAVPGLPAFADAPVPQDLLLDYLADPAAFTLIDARSAAEFAAAHIAGAHNLPADMADLRDAALPESTDDLIVVYCRSGERAARLKARLDELGYRDVRVLDPRQIFWSDGLAVFNCGAAPDATTFVPPAARTDSPLRGETE